MIGVVILAILASVAVPSFRAWLQNTQIRNAAASILSGMQRARSEAVGRNVNVEFVLSDDSAWVVKVASSVDNIDSRPISEGSRNVQVAITPNGRDTITYNSLGGIQAANLDGSLPFTQVDVDSLDLLPQESREMRVTVGAGGAVRMCDPNAPAGNPSAC